MSKISELQAELDSSRIEIKRLNEVLKQKNETLASMQTALNSVSDHDRERRSDVDKEIYREIAMNLAKALANHPTQIQSYEQEA